MFKSSDTRYRLAHRGVARRLGVEAMETRLMLSAASLDLMQEYLHPTLSTLNVSQSSLSPPRPILTATLAEGGFFILTSSQSGQRFDGIVLPTDPVSSAAIQYTASGGIRGGGHLFYFDSAGDTWNFNIRPVTIGPLDLKPAIVPISVSGIEPTNGGVITIESILNTVETGGGSQTVEQVKTTSLGAIASEPRQAMKYVSVSSVEEIAISDEDIAISVEDTSVPGEWARAVMFEITGGEPVKIDRPTPGERNKWSPKPVDAAISNGGEPLSFKGDSSPAVAYRTGDRQSDDGANDRESGAPLLIESIELTEVAVARLNSFVLVNDHSNPDPLVITPPTPEGDANAEWLRMSDSHVSGSVLAESLEQLSDGAPSFADDDWQRAFEATLVMLVLSLEQTTLRNSRQGEKGPSTLSARPPRRSL